MNRKNRTLLAVLWALSLVAVWQWTSRAQAVQPGLEVRLIRSEGKPGQVTGALVANVGGQWLPVIVDNRATPDPNSILGAR